MQKKRVSAAVEPSEGLARSKLLGLRWGVLAALLLCAWLGPLQSTIWNGSKAPAIAYGAPWTAPQLSWQRATFGGSGYYFFGRFFVLVYVGCLLSLWTLWVVGIRQKVVAVRRWFGLLFAALCLAMVGDIVAYWGGSVWGKQVRFVGFWLTEVPALIVSLIAITGLGFGIQREPQERSLGRCLMASIPVALLFTGLLQYMPHGPMMALCLGCGLLVFGLKRSTPGSARVCSDTGSPTAAGGSSHDDNGGAMAPELREGQPS